MGRGRPLRESKFQVSALEQVVMTQTCLEEEVEEEAD